MSNYQTLDGPAVYGALSVTTTPVEVKVGASREQGRNAITIQPLDGDIWLGYSNGLTTANGTRIYATEKFILECTDSLEVWIRSNTGTVDTRIAEIG
jgi:hypothetical protein